MVGDETGQKLCLQVTAAVIVDRGRILITRRPPGTHLAGYWEFPGGKQEQGEGLEDCLRREIEEELGLTVRVGRKLLAVEHEYASKIVSLHVFHCLPVAGRLIPKEDQEIRWVSPSELPAYRFPAPDRALIERLSSGQGAAEGGFPWSS